MSTTEGGGRIITNGLVLSLDAANSKSYINNSTIWNDLSLNQGILTTTGGTSGVTGNIIGVNFDGITGKFISNLAIEPPNNKISISCWFKATGPSNNNDYAGGVLIVNTPQLGIGYMISYSWQDQRIVVSTKVNDFFDTGLNSVLRNTIYNVICTYDGSQQLIYINGVLIASRPYSVAMSYPSSGDRFLRIGNWEYATYLRNFNGIIYQMLVYNKTLTPFEISQNYNITKSRFGL